MFRGTRGGMVSESVYGRAWHAARLAALGPDLAVTTLACRPYDLRHGALSLLLNASGEPGFEPGQAKPTVLQNSRPHHAVQASSCTTPPDLICRSDTVRYMYVP